MKIHIPRKPKTREVKKQRAKEASVTKNPTTKLTPFIPDKDKTHKPFKMKSFIKGLFTYDPWSGGFISGFVHLPYRPNQSIKGRIKHANEVRAIKKAQRRRAYLKMCRA